MCLIDRRCLVVTPLYDTEWITKYMHKESEMTLCDLPPDLEAIKDFLSDAPGKPKEVDAKMSKLSKMAKEDGLGTHSTFSDVCLWLIKATNVDKTVATSKDDAQELNIAKKLHKYLTASVELSEAMKRELAKREPPPPAKRQAPEKRAALGKQYGAGFNIPKPSTSEQFLEMFQNM